MDNDQVKTMHACQPLDGITILDLQRPAPNQKSNPAIVCSPNEDFGKSTNMCKTFCNHFLSLLAQIEHLVV